LVRRGIVGRDTAMYSTVEFGWFCRAWLGRAVSDEAWLSVVESGMADAAGFMWSGMLRPSEAGLGLAGYGVAGSA
jgi:hypothetical protein